jgi:hypothetical protein
MIKSTDQSRDIYIRDAGDRVLAVSEEGLRIEAATGNVAGGGLFDWPSDGLKPSSIVVLVAFLIRTDDVRCKVACARILVDGLASSDTIMVTEASGQPNGENLSYEVMIYSENAPSMRM